MSENNNDVFEANGKQKVSKKEIEDSDPGLIGLAIQMKRKGKTNYYPYLFRKGEIVKPTGKKEKLWYNPVCYGKITDYKVLRQYGDNGAVIHQMTLLANEKEYFIEASSTKEIAEWAMQNNFAKKKDMFLEFLNMTISVLRDEVSEYGIMGGYRQLEHIPEPRTNKPATRVTKWLDENMGIEQLRLFKSLILLPFHAILRTDETAQPRGLVRSPIGQGDSGCLKTFITNFYWNCFVSYYNIPLTDNKSSDTMVALRNDCHQNTGILLADEADKLMVDQTIGNCLKEDAINFLKRIEQYRSLNVADLNNQGSNINHKLNSTPVFLWNMFIEYIDPALVDRILLCEFHKENKPIIKEKWSLRKGKRQMLIFGEHIAIAFKRNYDQIKVSDTETATHIILDYMIEEFGYDLNFLKEVDFVYANELHDMDYVKDSIVNALRSYVKQSLIDKCVNVNGGLKTGLDAKTGTQQLQDAPKFKSHLSKCTDELFRIKAKSFTDWVNRKVLKSGETSKEEIANMFNWEIVTYAKTKVFEVQRNELDNILDLNTEEEASDK